ncbi:outer membrane beta-barrel protein [Pontibacter mangrovi]|nr:outer membrane beta-barrel protein [Pontibacter mangrovi]
MKKLLAAAVFTLLGTGAFAQTSQGTVKLSGSLGFNSTSRDDNINQKSNSFNIGPSIGYFIKDNLAVGMGAEVFAGNFRINRNLLWKSPWRALLFPI